MSQKIAVVGAGLIGASIGFNLARQGADVLLIEAGLPGAAASGRSFGWINAGYYLDEAHHHLRAEGIAAWHRLQSVLPDLPITWCGCLSWDVQGDALEAQLAELRGFGYPAQRLTPPQIAECAPALSREVTEALWLGDEGVAEADQTTHHILRAAQGAGARLVSGCPVISLSDAGGRIDGVVTAEGRIAADKVIVAAGTATPRLVDPYGVHIPMLTRPGAVMRSAPLPPLLSAVMVSPDLEFRQDRQGCLIAPSAASHQSDVSERLDATAPELAQDTLRRLCHWLPDVPLEWEDITLAMRPVPEDGRPVVGPCGPDGLYVSVMHSGVTLGALMGELVAREVLQDAVSNRLAPYRAQRFAVARV